MNKNLSGAFGLILFVMFIGAQVGSCQRSIRFDQEIESHLKAAADAQTAETAQHQLDLAVGNIERWGLTSGKTGIFWSNEQNDVGVWYRNLKSAQADLRRLAADSNQMTQTNTLMRLRETIMDHVQEGEKVTLPDHIDAYPHIFRFNVFPVILLAWSIFFGVRWKWDRLKLAW